MHRLILDKSEITNPLNIGIDKIANIVKRTLGPGGLPIILERRGQALDGSPLGPRITKDGVSVARECHDPDPAINVVIQAVKDICKKTNSDAGDGTTTAIILGQAIYHEMIRRLDTQASLNPQLVKESVEAASKEVIERLKNHAHPVDNMEMIRSVATISANGDAAIGDVICEAFTHVGAEGVVTVNEGSGPDVSIEKVSGYQFNRGAEARDAFFNSEARTFWEAESKEQRPLRVLIYDGKLQNHLDLMPLFTSLAGNAKDLTNFPPVLIIANEFSVEVIQWMLIQNMEQGLTLCPVRGPNTTNIRRQYLDDIACYTDGVRLGNGGRALSAATVADLGTAGRAVVTKATCTLYEGVGTEEAILTRVDQLKVQKQGAESAYDAQLINDRIAALTNGIAKIGVGGVTDLEVKERYDRIEDALNAARSAIQEGVIAGGGTALLRISTQIFNEELEDVGMNILAHAISIPFVQILENIGITGDDVLPIMNHLLHEENQALVYNARSKTYVDYFQAGLFDPLKVTRSALENAVSIAGLLATAGGAIVYSNEKVANDE